MNFVGSSYRENWNALYKLTRYRSTVFLVAILQVRQVTHIRRAVQPWNGQLARPREVYYTATVIRGCVLPV